MIARAEVEATGPADSADDTRAVPKANLLIRWSKTTAFWILGVDIVLALLFSEFSTQHRFASTLNAQLLMANTSVALLLALGLAMMMGAGLIDLSLGANLILSSVVGSLVLRHLGAVTPAAPKSGTVGQIALALIASLGTGVAFGLVNGLIITVLKVNSLIATLGTLGMGTGLAFVLTNGSDVTGLPTNMQSGFGLKTIQHVPLPLIMTIAIGALLSFVLRYCQYGLRTLAIGSNSDAATRSGLKVQRHIVSLTALGGFLAGLAGFVDMSRFGSTNVSGHSLDALSAVTAVVIGGTALLGGRVTIAGTFWGAALAAILLDGLVVMNVQPFYQQIATGGILVTAVSIDQFRESRRVKSSRANASTRIISQLSTRFTRRGQN